MNYKKITVATLAIIAIVLCTILAISVFGATIKLNPYAESKRLKKELAELKTELTDCEESIKTFEAKIAAEEKNLPGLKEKLAAAEKSLKTANENLDAVCSRSYYSSYFCEEEANCKELHEKVSSEETKRSNAFASVSDCEEKIENAKTNLSDAKNRKTDLESEISIVSSSKSKASAKGFFFFVAMLAAAAGFIVFAKYLYCTDAKKFGYMACALMAVSSLIYILLPTKTPSAVYLISLILYIVLYSLIAGSLENRVALRVIAIIISVIVLSLTMFSAPFISPLYFLTMILVTMVLVPCVFTEYLDIAKFIFYTIITFGIWYFIWIYNVTENLNQVESAEKRAPVRELLLCIFLPFYHVFWLYKTAEITELYGKERENHFKIDILCLAFAFVCPIISSILIQDKTNIIVGKPE